MGASFLAFALSDLDELKTWTQVIPETDREASMFNIFRATTTTLVVAGPALPPLAVPTPTSRVDGGEWTRCLCTTHFYTLRVG